MSVFTKYPQTAEMALEQVHKEVSQNQFKDSADKLIRVLESLLTYPDQNPEKEKFVKTEQGWIINPEWENICKSKKQN